MLLLSNFSSNFYINFNLDWEIHKIEGYNTDNTSLDMIKTGRC